MFTYYDGNENKALSLEELNDIAQRDHLSKLSQLCQLTDLLVFDDADNDESINLKEFYQAFSKYLPMFLH